MSFAIPKSSSFTTGPPPCPAPREDAMHCRVHRATAARGDGRLDDVLPGERPGRELVAVERPIVVVGPLPLAGQRVAAVVGAVGGHQRESTLAPEPASFAFHLPQSARGTCTRTEERSLLSNDVSA